MDPLESITISSIPATTTDPLLWSIWISVLMTNSIANICIRIQLMFLWTVSGAFVNWKGITLYFNSSNFV